MIDIKTSLRQATRLLSQTSETARLDAEVLLTYVLNKTNTYLYSHPEVMLTDAETLAYEALIQKRYQGEPIAYLVGQQEFWSLPLEVNAHTLIPRPETELLVETTLSVLKDKPDACILELGTGSGAIAFALAAERPQWQIVACDVSQNSLEVAAKNQLKLQLNNVTLQHSNWFESIPKNSFDAIVSNPPYIAADDPYLNKGNIRFEPQQALISGLDGLDAIQHILHNSFNFLKPQGFVLIEHGYQQKEAVLKIFKQQGYKNTQCLRDIQGHDRVCLGQK